jgi:hypothetical protein
MDLQVLKCTRLTFLSDTSTAKVLFEKISRCHIWMLWVYFSLEDLSLINVMFCDVDYTCQM